MSPAPTAALADADLCVKCGLCLPHCPTYRLTQHEADGPRGRIALTQGLLMGSVPPSERLQAHLDGCLSCRACEVVCPAKVPYGRVLDAGRAALATPERTRLTRGMAVVLLSPWLRAALRTLLWLTSQVWDRPALRDATRLPQREAHRPPTRHAAAPTRWQRLLQLLATRPIVRRLRAVTAPQKARVALFTGCIGDIAERGVLHDTQALLRAAGIEVAIPTAQGCCGALHQHGGLPAVAAACASRNAQAFAGCGSVLPLATGCGAALRDLGGSGADALAPKVRDLCTALADALDAQPVALQPRPLRVGIHTACTQANVFGADDAIRRLLARIPQIELFDLAPKSGCCGAAGSAFITHSAQAAVLLAPKLDAAEGLDLIVSANIGCSLHLQAGLRGRGSRVPVLHPVSLLAQAMSA